MHGGCDLTETTSTVQHLRQCLPWHQDSKGRECIEARRAKPEVETRTFRKDLTMKTKESDLGIVCRVCCVLIRTRRVCNQCLMKRD